MDNKKFIKNCESAAYEVLTAWANDIRCYEVNGKKQFCLKSSHSFGTAYCDWSDKRFELCRALENEGATNVSGKVKWNYIELYFNKRKRPIKE